jgi:glycerol-3-phosphate O-acyltransferase
VHVSFAEPVLFDHLLDEHEPRWRDGVDVGSRSAGLAGSVDRRLGQRIMTGINEAAHVNAINLLAAILLATPKHAMGRANCRAAQPVFRSAGANARYSDRITFTGRVPEEIIAYGIELGARIREHPLGDVIAVKPDQAVLLTYFSNNVSHLLATPSLIASSLLNVRRVERRDWTAASPRRSTRS